MRGAAGPRSFNDEAAQALALTALVQLLADETRVTRFLRVTGLDGSELRGHMSDLAFLGGVLDFVLDDDTLLLAVAEAAGVRPELIARARRRLPGAPPGD